ncbi:MAG: hypothetical protein OXC31_00500 [Spirochaetaceae bacterium]|nr:hypothetical protein [Spirochaetaceae bacterium]
MAGIVAAIAVFSALVGAEGFIARDYPGKSGLKWFILSVMLSPVLALLLLLAASERPAQAAAPTASSRRNEAVDEVQQGRSGDRRELPPLPDHAIGVDPAMPPYAQWVTW